MARDRLAELRAQRQQQQGGGAGYNQSHEMADLRNPDRITPAQQPGNGYGGSYNSPPPQNNANQDPMTQFYDEVAAIQDDISTYNSNVSRISELQQRSLNSTDEQSNRQTTALLDDLVAQTRDLGNSIKQRIQNLEMKPVQPGEDVRMRKNRLSFLRNKFVEGLQNYQQVERDYRARYKQRVERQFKIVKPDATPEEIDAVVNDVQGSGDQIFAQALTSSTRYGEGRAAYREVQDRHQDIKRIERTLEELAQLFNDMSVLVAQQDDAINAIETAAAGVEADTEAAVKQTEKAVEHARSARRKRWICFFLFLVILAIVAIVVGVVVSQNVKKN
ncbi:t-SNARE [Panus rudis PR-1116 ss-1]|nr:t-SNARE [Panus rudis PR-1116 ss-1]